MKRNPWLAKALSILLASSFIAGIVMAEVITEHDSTQPRGSPGGTNDLGQSTDPISDGFRAPARFGNAPDNIFQNSMGSIMSYSARDPSVFAASSLATVSH